MKKITALAGILAVITIGVVFSLFNQNNTKLSETEIWEKFRCDRITADVLATDIYCQNPKYYYEDAKKGAVINPSDLHDPRYKAMFED